MSWKTVCCASILFLLSGIATQAQPFAVTDLAPVDILAYSYLDNTLASEVKLVKLDPSKSEPLLGKEDLVQDANGFLQHRKGVPVQQIVQSLPDRPTLILLWKIEFFLTHSNTQQTIERIRSLQNALGKDYNLLLVNISNLHQDGGSSLGEPVYHSSELNTLDIIRGIPTYIDYLQQFNQLYGLDAPLAFLSLDKNDRIVASGTIGERVNESVDFFQQQKRKAFTAGKLLFDADDWRTDNAAAAVSEVKIVKMEDRIQVTKTLLASGKLLFRYSYKTTSPIQIGPYKYFFPDGKFEFDTRGDGSMTLKGDAYYGFVDNVIGVTNGKTDLEITHFAAFNRNVFSNLEKVRTHLSDQTLYRASDNLPLATLVEYHPNFTKKAIRQFDAMGHRISTRLFFDSGNPEKEITWNSHKEYNREGILILSFAKIDGGRRHGLYTEYYANGRLKTKVMYAYGESDPTSLERYYENGKPQEMNKKDGSTIYYYSNGQEWGKFILMRAGQQATYYYENGKPAAILQFDTNGKVDCSSVFYDNKGNRFKKPYDLHHQVALLRDLYIELMDGPAAKGEKKRTTDANFDFYISVPERLRFVAGLNMPISENVICN